MRVISQDGMIDVPYDMSVANVDYRNKKEIIATIAGCGEIENLCRMAKYSTKAKAIKAMEMLHNEWLDYGSNGLFQFPKDEEIEVEDE